MVFMRIPKRLVKVVLLSTLLGILTKSATCGETHEDPNTIIIFMQENCSISSINLSSYFISNLLSKLNKSGIKHGEATNLDNSNSQQLAIRSHSGSQANTNGSAKSKKVFSVYEPGLRTPESLSPIMRAHECTLEFSAYHHLNCNILHLKYCNGAIKHYLIKQLLKELPCVLDVEYDIYTTILDPMEDGIGRRKSYRVKSTSSSTHFNSENLVQQPYSMGMDQFKSKAAAYKTNESFEKKAPEGNFMSWFLSQSSDAHKYNYANEQEAYPYMNQGFPNPSTNPNDSYFKAHKQWSLQGSPGVGAEHAWALNIGGDGSIREQPQNALALIDFGFNLKHEDLWWKWWRNYNVSGPSEWPFNCYDEVDNDNNGYVDDCIGYSFAQGSALTPAFLGSHGTGVACVCCAETKNKKGVASLGWNIRPMPLHINGAYSQMIEAFNYATDKGVKVVNLSLGGPHSSALYKALRQLEDKDVLVVVASGNHSCNLQEIGEEGCRSYDGKPKGYPAAYSSHLSNLLSVAASTYKGKLARFSNFDASASLKNIQLSAPGKDLVTCSETNPKEYGVVHGTSFASPLVAALAALLRYENPALTSLGTKHIFQKACLKGRDRRLQAASDCSGYFDVKAALLLAGLKTNSRKHKAKSFGLRNATNMASVNQSAVPTTA